MGGGESRFDEKGGHSGRIGQDVVGDGFVGAMMMGQLFPAQEMGDDDIRSRPGHSGQLRQRPFGVIEVGKRRKADDVIEACRPAGDVMDVGLEHQVPAGGPVGRRLPDHVPGQIKSPDPG